VQKEVTYWSRSAESFTPVCSVDSNAASIGRNLSSVLHHIKITKKMTVKRCHTC